MSANKNDNLIHSANQIAAYFEPYGHEEAVAGVASHIKRFWEKRMRTQLDAHIAEGGAGLNNLVLEAVKRLQ